MVIMVHDHARDSLKKRKSRAALGSVVRLEVDDASKNDQAALFGGWPNGYDD